MKKLNQWFKVCCQKCGSDDIHISIIQRLFKDSEIQIRCLNCGNTKNIKD